MLREDCSVGLVIVFGRKHGEKTKGKVIKCNLQTAKIQTIEDRGSRTKAGDIWNVPYSLMEKYKGSEEIPEIKSKPKREPLVYNQFQEMNEVYICLAIEDVYFQMSPETLTCDGEASRAHVAKRSRLLAGRLNHLFAALGREVTEEEIYAWSEARKKNQTVLETK